MAWWWEKPLEIAAPQLLNSLLGFDNRLEKFHVRRSQVVNSLLSKMGQVRFDFKYFEGRLHRLDKNWQRFSKSVYTSKEYEECQAAMFHLQDEIDQHVSRFEKLEPKSVPEMRKQMQMMESVMLDLRREYSDFCHLLDTKRDAMWDAYNKYVTEQIPL